MKNYCDACGDDQCSILKEVNPTKDDDWTECCYCRYELRDEACIACLERYPKDICPECLQELP